MRTRPLLIVMNEVVDPYEPRGGSDGGDSLNVDPITGRSYLANTP